MQWFFVIFSVALLSTGCRPTLDKKLVGEWQSGCSIDICTITSLKPDHTFGERFDEKDLSGPVLSGTWHTEDQQLILHVTWELESPKTQRVVGRDLRYIISDVQRDTFIAAFAETNESLYWRRLK